MSGGTCELTSTVRRPFDVDCNDGESVPHRHGSLDKEPEQDNQIDHRVVLCDVDSGLKQHPSERDPEVFQRELRTTAHRVAKTWRRPKHFVRCDSDSPFSHGPVEDH